MWEIQVDKGRGEGWRGHVLDIPTKAKAEKELERLKPTLEGKFGWVTQIVKVEPYRPSTRQPSSLSRLMGG